MFDTMTLTKIVGGFCGAFLIFLLGGWGAELVSHRNTVEAHGEEEVHQAYVIDVPEAGADAAPVEEGPPFEEVYASADPAAGEASFRPCAACHALAAGDNRTGPTLYGVVDRPVDSVEGYDYSGALEEVVDVWDVGHLNLFLENPQGYAPGTKMTYGGMRDVQDRANLIAWLATNPGG
jgi:cytochrome c